MDSIPVFDSLECEGWEENPERVEESRDVIGFVWIRATPACTLGGLMSQFVCLRSRSRSGS